MSVHQIQQQLTCPICLDRYKEPKLLPCQHTFCLNPCLYNLVDWSNRCIKCPECRRVFNLPSHGLETLPNNITIMRFLELTNSGGESRNQVPSDKCSECLKKLSDLKRCLDCEKYFCVNCHPAHLVQLKNDSRQSVTNLRKILPMLSQKVGNFEQKKTIINQNYDAIRFEISSIVDKLIEELKMRERCLHAEAEVNAQSQIRTINLEKENAEVELASISSFCDTSEAALNRTSQSHENEYAIIRKQCRTIVDQFNSSNQTEANSNAYKINLNLSDLNNLLNSIKNFGSIHVQSPSRNSSDHRPQNRQNPFLLSPRGHNTNDQRSHQSRDERPIMGGSRSIGYNLDLTNGSRNNSYNRRGPNSQSLNVSGPIRSTTFILEDQSENHQPNPNQPTRNVDITELYNVRRRARAKTPMAFNVMLDEPLDDDPNNDPGLPAILNQILDQPSINYASKTRAKFIFGRQGRQDGEFVWPVDVCVNLFNNHLFLTDSGNNRIQIFEPNGKFVKAFGAQGNREGQFDSTSGIFVDSMSNIFIVDRLNHRIQIFDRYCRFVRSVGAGQGSSPGELNYPWGIAVNRINEIFVCDKENDRVCVFHISGRFLRSFGVHGIQRGQFDKPHYIHITKDNRVLVSDCLNNRIQIFDSNGNFLDWFGKEGSNPGEFKQPRGICTDAEGFILVADSGNARVQVFRADGRFVTSFGGFGSESGKFRGMEGLTIAQNGDVIICDKENNRIQIM